MSEIEKAVEVVTGFLAASMAPDAIRAASYMHPDVKITFTGKREMPTTKDITNFNGARYKWVKKSVGQFDCMHRGDHVVVYSNGTLYGEWPDGRPFAGNRYLDRYEVRDGKIVKMDVWNDSAEWILAPEIARVE
ncbi:MULTISPECIES: nuclear transport factor 2 family protein [unclassified Brenneria]|uniref:nuclear transport factor 2 family protein n=1 Tax=unclassified Brenneria TaxID=2634434 RepID=UPI0015547612|nr:MULTISPECIES: nuclear transport factor 2 family protein [unclassified Brenneria]MBJ7223964.1 nuclear transport factor 2 family protein [Brenneria sp. L3-3C-1]MEE3645208.1 nuclear transport factor 2 family protein [Brenneria sp. L3_3C_1]MEE3649909.1 nuclear transport factor 2 family protein [Brenneria sp. HEZEL_4_2_4]NPC99867.1 nuclear transport factor 2 family protein [Brenneria sp. hezel4-2-4]